VNGRAHHIKEMKEIGSQRFPNQRTKLSI